MFFRTNYCDYCNRWMEMVLDEQNVAFRYDLSVNQSGAFFFVTSFHPFVFSLSGYE